MKFISNWRLILFLPAIILLNSCPSTTEEEDSASGLNTVCCSYEMRTTSSYSTGSWELKCTCAYSACSEIETSETDYYSGGYVRTERRNITQVADCGAINEAANAPECTSGEKKCVSSFSYKIRDNGKWSSTRDCDTECFLKGYNTGSCANGSCVCK